MSIRKPRQADLFNLDPQLVSGLSEAKVTVAGSCLLTVFLLVAKWTAFVETKKSLCGWKTSGR